MWLKLAVEVGRADAESAGGGWVPTAYEYLFGVNGGTLDGAEHQFALSGIVGFVKNLVGGHWEVVMENFKADAAFKFVATKNGTNLRHAGFEVRVDTELFDVWAIVWCCVFGVLWVHGLFCALLLAVEKFVTLAAANVN